MRGGGSPWSGGRRAGFSGDRTPEMWDVSRSSTVSSSSSGGGKSSSSSFGRNPMLVAAKAIGQCFGSSNAGSNKEDYAADLKSTSATSSSSTHGSSYGSTRGRSYGSSHGNEKLRSGRGMYSGGPALSSHGESGEMKFTMAEIHKATKNFSPSFKIGQGGFGTVYKGTLDDGTVVAVKRAKKSFYDNHLSVEFQSEIQTLARVEHLNLVRFLGYLEYEDERIVVVEFVPNGTLREHLDGLHGSTLDLAARLDIAIDVAHAVTYLHMYTDHPIIHRDIKSSNILLTENLRAKVADFGFARLGATETGVTHVSTQVKGTAGYLDPEYLKTYQLTEKSDVYSFGVLLVELMSGRRPIEPKKELKERITAKWAIKKFTDGNAIDALDPNLPLGPATNLALEKVLELALQCLAPTRRSRPSMRRCAEILWSIRKDYRELLSSDPLSCPSHQRKPSISSIKEEVLIQS